MVCTEEYEIYPSTDLSPYPEQRLWDERDIPALSLMVEAVHGQGSLAGIERVHNGHMASNLMTRLPVLSVGERQLADGYPKMARVLDAGYPGAAPLAPQCRAQRQTGGV